MLFSAGITVVLAPVLSFVEFFTWGCVKILPVIFFLNLFEITYIIIFFVKTRHFIFSLRHFIIATLVTSTIGILNAIPNEIHRTRSVLDTSKEYSYGWPFVAFEFFTFFDKTELRISTIGIVLDIFFMIVGFIFILTLIMSFKIVTYSQMPQPSRQAGLPQSEPPPPDPSEQDVHGQ
jgi:hypothetical protein